MQVTGLEKDILNLNRYSSCSRLSTISHNSQKQSTGLLTTPDDAEIILLTAEGSTSREDHGSVERIRSASVNTQSTPNLLGISNPNVNAILEKYNLSDLKSTRNNLSQLPTTDRNYVENLAMIANNLANVNLSFSNMVQPNSNLTKEPLRPTTQNFANLQTPLFNKTSARTTLRPSSSDRKLSLHDQLLNTVSSRINTEGDLPLSSNKENFRTPSPFLATPQTEKKNAVAEAMKALQERLKKADDENTALQNKISNLQKMHNKTLEEQGNSFREQINNLSQKLAAYENTANTLAAENNTLKETLSKTQALATKQESELTTLKLQIMKQKEEINLLNQERALSQKEIEALENEKNRHLEQNAQDRDNFERKIEELLSQLEAERRRLCQAESEKTEAFIAQQKYETEINRLMNENAALERRCQEMIKEHDQRVLELQRHNQILQNELTSITSLYEKDKANFSKRISEMEKSLQNMVTSYEERLETLNQETNDLKKQDQNQRDSLEAERKKIALFEKTKVKLEALIFEKDDIIKQLIEINNEVMAKLKKDSSNPHFKDLWYKKKKIEALLEKQAQEKQPANRRRKSKSRSKSHSRSPSHRKSLSNGKRFLTVEDLEEPEIIQNKKGTPKLNDSGVYVSQRVSTLTTENKYPSSPVRSASHASLNGNVLLKKKTRSESKSVEKVFSNEVIRGADIFRSGRQSLISETESAAIRKNLGLGVSTTGHPERSASMARLSTNSINPTSNEPNTPAPTHLAKNSEENMIITQPQVTTKQQNDIERMSQEEVSMEIVKVEREITELKREYKNLLNKLHNNANNEPNLEVRNRLNTLASELNLKAELYKLLKLRQRELLAQNI